MSHLRPPDPPTAGRSPSPSYPQKGQTLVFKINRPPARKQTEKGSEYNQASKQTEVNKKLSKLRARVEAFEKIRQGNPEEFSSLVEFRPTGKAYNDAYDAYHEAYHAIQGFINLHEVPADREHLAAYYQPEFNTVGAQLDDHYNYAKYQRDLVMSREPPKTPAAASGPPPAPTSLAASAIDFIVAETQGTNIHSTDPPAWHQCSPSFLYPPSPSRI